MNVKLVKGEDSSEVTNCNLKHSLNRSAVR